MTELNNLFEAATTTQGARSLTGTAQLTLAASNVAATIIAEVNNNIDAYKDKMAASQASHSAMDELITELGNLQSVDVEFIKELSDAEQDSMLKSQQSKRSRAIGKPKTLENYTTLMTGAVAENLIRLATGKSKQLSGSRLAGRVSYTAEELTELEQDQDLLRKAVRNIQSKKSIMKSKEDFSEEGERWIEMLAVEQTLKSLRNDTVRIDKTTKLIVDILNDATVEDIQAMKAPKLKEMLSSIAGVLALAGYNTPAAPVEETVTEDAE